VAARLLTLRAGALLALVQQMMFSPPDGDPDGVKARNAGADHDAAFTQALELLCAAAEQLRPRAAAGTLLRGSCLPEELAYGDHFYGMWSEKHHPENPRDRRERSARLRLQSFGEDVLFLAGSNALVALSVHAQMFREPPATFAGGKLMGMLALTRETCALLTTPRTHLLNSPRHERGLTDQEIYFAQRCQTIMGEVFSPEHVSSFPSGPALAVVAVPLQRLWRDLQRSPALKRALSDDMQASYASGHESLRASMHAQLEAQRKHSCAHCGAAEAVRGDFKACARCRGAYYCSREHQVAHWRPAHKAECKKRT
jgi:hypothetical protein